VLNASQAGDLITYAVRIPGDDSITASYRGPLYIKIKADGRTTGPGVQFNIIPALPKINSHVPQYGAPGRTTTFRGVNFKATDEIFVTNAPGIKLEFHSPTEIAVTLPTNYPTTDKYIKVVVRRQGTGSPTSSPQPYMYALDPKLYTGSKEGNQGQK
jgi:hypothetical protein